MEKIPKVSIIIPTYNRKEYLPDAIDSVLAQTYKLFEIVLVDDGSTDGTGEILKEKYGDKIRYFFKENGGCASARNYGIRMAQGDHIAFLDSDDKYLVEKLEDQVALLNNRKDIGFVYSDSYAFNDNGRTLSPSVRPDRNDSVAIPLFMLTYMANGSFLVRRKCLDIAGYYNESLRYNEDTDLMLKLAINFKAYYAKKPTLAYRIHTGRKSGNSIKLLESVYESSVSLLKEYHFFSKQLGRRAHKRLGQIRLCIALEYMIKKDFAKVIEELALSHKLYPMIKKKIYSFLLSQQTVQGSIVPRVIAYFEQIIMKGLQWYLYKYTGWII